ncbi:recombinase RecT [Nonomuraea sp. 10N515B]|uniref:recombinase RecT n=1 Tax=Nonomuraea sp. 10N515B TaxID=3457422 RepID=UPI003FCD9906
MNARQPSAALERQIAQLSDLVVDHEKILREALPEGMSIRQVMRDALQLVQKTPKLAGCYDMSVIGGLVNFAQLGLRPGVGALGHGWLLPMWNNRESRLDATMVIGYRGYVALGYRDPAVQAIAAHCVYTNDTFKHVLHGARGTVEHTMAEGDRGLPDRYYGAAVVRGVDIVTETWTQADMNLHRDRYALAKNREGKLVGPWALGPNGSITKQAIEMGKKTMIRGPLAKMIPATWQLTTAGAIDDGGVREDIDPAVDPVTATVHPNRPEEQPEADPTQQVRESVTIRETFPTGGLTGDQDRAIGRLVRDRKMSREAALDVVERLFGERKSARQLTEEQAAQLIAELGKIPLPTMKGEILTPGRPSAEPD